MRVINCNPMTANSQPQSTYHRVNVNFKSVDLVQCQERLYNRFVVLTNAHYNLQELRNKAQLAKKEAVPALDALLIELDPKLQKACSDYMANVNEFGRCFKPKESKTNLK